MSMKMKAPEGFTGGSIGGRELRVGSDGTCPVDAIDVSSLLGLGFTRADDDETVVPVEDMERDQLITRIMATTRSRLESMSTDEIRDAVKDMDHALAKKNPPPPNDPPHDPPGLLSAEDIGKMSRDELMAWLKDHDVQVPGNMSNDNLRAKVAETQAAK